MCSIVSLTSLYKIILLEAHSYQYAVYQMYERKRETKRVFTVRAGTHQKQLYLLPNGEGEALSRMIPLHLHKVSPPLPD